MVQEIPVPKLITSRDWIDQRIKYYADLYGVSEITMNHIVKCESGFNPNAINSTPREYSVGLSQINLMAHAHITESEAKDVDFALDFLASNLKAGNGKIWTCWHSR